MLLTAGKVHQKPHQTSNSITLLSHLYDLFQMHLDVPNHVGVVDIELRCGSHGAILVNVMVAYLVQILAASTGTLLEQVLAPISAFLECEVVEVKILMKLLQNCAELASLTSL